MITRFLNGQIVFVPETESDLRLVLGKTTSPSTSPETLEKKSHKTYARHCPKCNEKFSGRQGLAVHDVRTHQGRNWSSKSKEAPTTGPTSDTH